MKLTWKNQNKNNKRPLSSISHYPNLPFDQHDDSTPKSPEDPQKTGDGASLRADQSPNDTANDAQASDDDETRKLADTFQAQGDRLAEDGRYHEALGKWETALTLMPDRAVLHEQKAQVLLEIGAAWSALKAATRATELEPSWAEAWITAGRAQLNFGEPDSAIKSFDRALAIKPDSIEARDDQQTALHLVKKRRQLHLSGLSSSRNRYVVGDKIGN